MLTRILRLPPVVGGPISRQTLVEDRTILDFNHPFSPRNSLAVSYPSMMQADRVLLGSDIDTIRGEILKYIFIPDNHSFIAEAVFAEDISRSTCLYVTIRNRLDYSVGIPIGSIRRLCRNSPELLPIDAFLDPTVTGSRSQIDYDFPVVPPIFDGDALFTFMNDDIETSRPSNWGTAFISKFKPLFTHEPALADALVRGVVKDSPTTWIPTSHRNMLLGHSTFFLLDICKMESQNGSIIVLNDRDFDMVSIDMVSSLYVSFDLTVDLYAAVDRPSQYFEWIVNHYNDQYMFMFGNDADTMNKIRSRIGVLINQVGKSYARFLRRSGLLPLTDKSGSSLRIIKNDLDEIMFVIDDKMVCKRFIFYTSIPLLMMTTWGAGS